MDKDPLVCNRLGDAYYRYGKGEKKNSNKVIALYEYACSIDNFDSCRRLAEIYSKGELVDQNYDKAFEYSKRYAKKSQEELFLRQATTYQEIMVVEQKMIRKLTSYLKLHVI